VSERALYNVRLSNAKNVIYIYQWSYKTVETVIYKPDFPLNQGVVLDRFLSL